MQFSKKPQFMRKKYKKQLKYQKKGLLQICVPAKQQLQKNSQFDTPTMKSLVHPYKMENKLKKISVEPALQLEGNYSAGKLGEKDKRARKKIILKNHSRCPHRSAY